MWWTRASLWPLPGLGGVDPRLSRGDAGGTPPRPATHAQCLGHASPAPAPSPTQGQFSRLWVFIQFAMTFHGEGAGGGRGCGVNNQALRAWRGGRRGRFCWGRLVPRGQSMCNIGPSRPRTLAGPRATSRPSGEAQGGPHRGAADRPPPPRPPGGAAAGLQDKGVRATGRAQVGFAKCLITRPGIVPARPPGALASFPAPCVLSGPRLL